MNQVRDLMTKAYALAGGDGNLPNLIGTHITGPLDLAVLLRARDVLAKDCDLGNTCPTEVFLFGVGEPNVRAATIVGGLPYWPKDRAWPTAPDGKPLTFLFQLNDQHGSYLSPDNRKGIMLVFAHHDDLGWPNDEDALTFVWVPHTDAELLPQHMLPEPSFNVPSSYGVSVETVDYTESRAEELFYQRLGSWNMGVDRRALARALCALPGTKIGGMPYVIPQADEPDINSYVEGMQFLASFCGVVPRIGTLCPWVNQESALSFDDADVRKQFFFLRDGHVMNIWKRNSQICDWTVQFW